MEYSKSTPRAKEWLQFCTQQLRLRNLTQVLACNITLGKSTENCEVKSLATKEDLQTTESVSPLLGSPFKWQSAASTKKPLPVYFTLHLTNMSAPFYMSETVEDAHPMWAELDPLKFPEDINIASSATVLRLWVKQNKTSQVVTVWGVQFTGLVFLGEMPPRDPSAFASNTVIFRMKNGFFTAEDCLKNQTGKAKQANLILETTDTVPSYNVSLLLRLHTIQRAMRHQTLKSCKLRNDILSSGFDSESSCTVPKRNFICSSKTSNQRDRMKLREEIESARFRVKLLKDEKEHKSKELKKLLKMKNDVHSQNEDKSTELLQKYHCLQKDIKHLEEMRKSIFDLRESFLKTTAHLTFRRKQLISELSVIYPVTQLPEGGYAICGVLLPNSEDFYGHDEMMISVALGYVAHMVQMISYFLQVPLRYPVKHMGSRSKIIDHVTSKIPDKDREFVLYSKGKDKLQFNYGVYLLNKNVSQLRWCFGLVTHDLRATLPNLAGLLQLWLEANINESDFESTAVSRLRHPLPLESLSPSPHFNLTPPGNRQEQGSETGIEEKKAAEKKGHRVSKSLGENDFLVETSLVSASADGDIVSRNSESSECNSQEHVVTLTGFSYSLDKGLNELEDIKKTSCSLEEQSKGQFMKFPTVGGHHGSDSELHRHEKIIVSCHTQSSGDERQEQFLQTWHAGSTLNCLEDESIYSFNSSEGAAGFDSVQNKQVEKSGMENRSTEHNGDERNCDKSVNIPVNSDKKDVSHTWLNSDFSFGSDADEVFRTEPDDINSDRFKETKGCSDTCDEEQSAVQSIDSVTIDSMYLLLGDVASRTEALASRTSSFKLSRSRESTLDDDNC